MRDLINLTDEEIEARFGNCCTVEDLVFTAETIEDFKRARESYAERGKVIKDTADEYEVSRVQVRKGDARATLQVIDFGDVRAALIL